MRIIFIELFSNYNLNFIVTQKSKIVARKFALEESFMNIIMRKNRNLIFQKGVFFYKFQF